MKPDGRNLTPLRALALLRRLDGAYHQVNTQQQGEVRYAMEQARDALAAHVQYGLTRRRRGKR